jgi:hypothetical protein
VNIAEVSMKTLKLEWDRNSFESLVLKCCSFLQADRHMKFTGVREINSDGRDMALVASYHGDRSRVEIGWSELELSLGVLIRLDRADVPRGERWVYLEPFVYFTSDRKVVPVVPQIYYEMTPSQMLTVMEERETVFGDGLEAVLVAVMVRLDRFVDDMELTSLATLSSYQHWYQKGGFRRGGRD